MKRHPVIMIAVMLVCGFVTSSVVFGEPIVYPNKGQSEEQQSKDKWQCHEWAVKQTGVDPHKLAEEATTGEVYERHGGVLPGAARGAAIGAIAGDAGKGAAIGGTLGLMRQRRSLEQQHQAFDRAHQEQKQQLDQYDRAYGACLEGRGYTVR